MKIKIHRTIILPAVLHECETFSLTLREERRLCLLENRELRRIFVPKRDEVTGIGRNYIKMNLIMCTPHQILFGDRIEISEMGGACSTY